MALGAHIDITDNKVSAKDVQLATNNFYGVRSYNTDEQKSNAFVSMISPNSYNTYALSQDLYSLGHSISGLQGENGCMQRQVRNTMVPQAMSYKSDPIIYTVFA